MNGRKRPGADVLFRALRSWGGPLRVLDAVTVSLSPAIAAGGVGLDRCNRRLGLEFAIGDGADVEHPPQAHLRRGVHLAAFDVTNRIGILILWR